MITLERLKAMHIWHVPTLTGEAGRAAVTQFYRYATHM